MRDLLLISFVLLNLNQYFIIIKIIPFLWQNLKPHINSINLAQQAGKARTKVLTRTRVVRSLHMKLFKVCTRGNLKFKQAYYMVGGTLPWPHNPGEWHCVCVCVCARAKSGGRWQCLAGGRSIQGLCYTESPMHGIQSYG